MPFTPLRFALYHPSPFIGAEADTARTPWEVIDLDACPLTDAADDYRPAVDLLGAAWRHTDTGDPAMRNPEAPCSALLAGYGQRLPVHYSSALGAAQAAAALLVTPGALAAPLGPVNAVPWRRPAVGRIAHAMRWPVVRSAQLWTIDATPVGDL